MRRKHGYALITIIVIGFFAIAFLLILANIVTSAVRVISDNKWAESLRNAAEVGIDYAVNQYNSVPGGLDSSDPQTPTTSIALDPSLVQPLGIPNLTVNITSTRLINSDTTNWGRLRNMSSIYNPQLDPTRTSSSFLDPKSTSNLVHPGGGFRIITSTASNGAFSRSIRVILKARFDTPPDLNTALGDHTSPPAPNTSPKYQSIFPNTPFFSNGAIVLESSSLTIAGYKVDLNGSEQKDPVTSKKDADNLDYAAYDLNVQTNTFAEINANNTIIGDLSVFSSGSGTAPVVQIPGLVDGGTISGRLAGNGNLNVNSGSNSPIAPTGDEPPSVADANVLAKADTVIDKLAKRKPFNSSNPFSSPAGSQTLLSPTPMSATGQPLPPLAALNTSIQGLDATAGNTGNYSTNGLSTENVPSDSPVLVNNATPVSIFVQDGFGSNAININTKLIKTQSTNPSNFQIYYQGTDDVIIDVGGDNHPFNGLLYAPNARVTIKGTGNFKGAIVGGSVTVNLDGEMNLNTDLFSPPGTDPAVAEAKAKAKAAAETPGTNYYHQTDSNGGPLVSSH